MLLSVFQKLRSISPICRIYSNFSDKILTEEICWVMWPVNPLHETLKELNPTRWAGRLLILFLVWSVSIITIIDNNNYPNKRKRRNSWSPTVEKKHLKFWVCLLTSYIFKTSWSNWSSFELFTIRQSWFMSSNRSFWNCRPTKNDH